MDNETLRLFSRLNKSGDGIELLKFLEDLSYKNYEEWKSSSPDRNEYYKGRALTLDELTSFFKNADERLSQQNREVKEWI